MADLLPFVDVETAEQPEFLVIWLHGLGDSGHGFAPIVPAFNLPAGCKVRFVFPHAPTRPITINNGMKMPGWYDIASMDIVSRADEAGVRESASQIEALIDAELAKGFKPEQMVLAGFSQGGVMAYHIGTRLPFKIAGILSLSTYLAVPEKLADEVVAANKQTPILAMHGTGDDVVPLKAGKMAADTLKDLGFNVTWREFAMQHNVCPAQIAEIGSWLQKVLKA
ncbi:carboxylesterase [Saccharobesus litoralis]|uniref:Carboxylesterase n=1 Tax=Saccharobesus litoralis TaxID=2172099 RepID=A0A2S0VQW4_9ALTE|nr:carboxylesterase [Saccharobesus litoralis]AWB66470.1 carboxylesterase [Saccharobesus litoralis]